MDGISIIIRSTGRPTLARALDSVRLQGRPDVQVVLVEAGALGLGRAAAAQHGLERVSTRWALFLDDDDELLPGHLDKLMEAAQRHPQAVAVHTGVVQVCAAEAPGQTFDQTLDQTPTVLATFDRAFEPWQLLAANHLPIHSVLFDAQRARSSGVRFDTAFEVFEDWDFWLQLQALGPFVHVPGVSARYWVSAPVQQKMNPSLVQSQAQSVSHGQQAYRAIWNKWWSAAPAPWWSQLMAWSRESPATHAQAKEELQQTQRYAQGLKEQWERSAADALRWVADYQKVQADLQGVRQDMQQVREDRDRLQALCEQTRDELTRTRSEAQAAAAQAGQALATVELLRQSRSWRYTAPLRWLGRGLRAMRHPAELPGRMLRLIQRLRMRVHLARHRSYPRPPVLERVLPDPYREWVARHESELAQEHRRAKEAIGALSALGASPMLISVVMPVYNPPLEFLDEAIESLRSQWWPHWQLCVADDASTDAAVGPHLRMWMQREPRIRLVTRQTNGHISASSNDALALAEGDWVVLFDQDDRLAPEALWRIVQALRQHPDAGLIYSDEDKIDEKGQRFGPYFKPAFDLQLFRGQNMISHLGAYRRDLLQAVGGFREGYEGSQDHDLALRCVERLRRDQVVHIPQVLYHWRVHAASTASSHAAKPYALDAGLRAVQDHLDRTGVPARAVRHPAIPHYRVHHDPRRVRDRGLHLVLWGPGAPARAGDASMCAQALSNLLGGQPLQAVTAEEHSIPAAVVRACERVRQSTNPQTTDLLVLHVGAIDHARWLEGDLDQWRAALLEPEVGSVACAVRRPDGSLADAAFVVDDQGQAHPMTAGLPSGHHGYYGQAALARSVSAASCSALLLRPGAVHQEPDEAASLKGLHLQAGWQLVWNPALSLQLPEFPKVSAHGEPLMINGTEICVWGASAPGYIDPAYSPHLSAAHADHRIERDQSLRNKAAATSPRLPSSV